MVRTILSLKSISILFCLCVISPANATDLLKLAVGQRGFWDTAIPEMASQAGIFQKHGLAVEILYTQGGGETMQAVISGSVDIGVAAGATGVLGAFAKGAPVRIIGSQVTGSADFWYVRSDSPLKSVSEAGPNTVITYSTRGSSTDSVVQSFIKKYNLKSKTLATGAAATTFTQVMSGQIEIGFAAPPFAFPELASGKIRIIARALDIDSVKEQSVRVLIANAQVVEKRADALRRFMAAYRETIDWMYSGNDALSVYAKFAGTDINSARKVRDEFFPKPMLNPDRISGVDALMEEAVTYKMLQQPLTQTQLNQLIRIPPHQ